MSIIIICLGKILLQITKHTIIHIIYRKCFWLLWFHDGKYDQDIFMQDSQWYWSIPDSTNVVFSLPALKWKQFIKNTCCNNWLVTSCILIYLSKSTHELCLVVYMAILMDGEFLLKHHNQLKVVMFVVHGWRFMDIVKCWNLSHALCFETHLDV